MQPAYRPRGGDIKHPSILVLGAGAFKPPQQAVGCGCSLRITLRGGRRNDQMFLPVLIKNERIPEQEGVFIMRRDSV